MALTQNLADSHHLGTYILVNIIRSNIILYCNKWEETVSFYQFKLALPILTSLNWFVEFQLNEYSCLSIADASNASMDSTAGRGITVTMKVNNIESVFATFKTRDLEPTPIKTHPWKAHVFYIFDPEGHRLEFWSSLSTSDNI